MTLCMSPAGDGMETRMQIGIRLHDINTELAPAYQTLESRAEKAREEGFSCVHLAFSKVFQGIDFDGCALTEGLAMHARHICQQNGLDVSVLGCYLNLAHPDPRKLKEIQDRYCGYVRVAALMGAGVVGTETGAPNPEYRMDANTHTKEALDQFIRGLAPVVECAEHYGVTMAIEPVWKHIVCDADRAVKVLKAIGSRNLRIILDPVNLLHAGNVEQRAYVIQDALEKLGDSVATVHLKDYVREGSELRSIAAGTGEMDYKGILRFMKERKPYIQATLENTSNENAVAAREFLEKAYEEV